ncbi:MAG: DUF2784 family protein [Bacteroidetes bacterium]|nr:DUF2784 family protein [Bacteroidota bacterium]
MTTRRSSLNPILLADCLVVFHAILVGITVAGGVAVFTGRFSKFQSSDWFAWSFITAAASQLISLVFTGGCVLTQWEKDLRLSSGMATDYKMTFLEQYLPFLPSWLIDGIPMLTLGALIGACIQFFLIRKRKQLRRPE